MLADDIKNAKDILAIVEIFKKEEQAELEIYCDAVGIDLFNYKGELLTLINRKMENIGHNKTDSQKLIQQVIEGIEFCEEKKRVLSEEIAERFAEAKANGLDIKILRKIIKLRKTDPEKARAEQAELEIYCDAVGIDLFSYKE